jgi:hypothetical protein
MLGKGKIQYKETVVGTRRLQYIYKNDNVGGGCWTRVRYNTGKQL